MATFDQLPADQRAIIELVLKRGRTYDALSDMLGMPTSRVRELARDALTELAPRSAARVDPDWRDQVADYALGQQSGAESVATQGHLRRSEAARAWLLSLMDSLDQLYANGNRPEIPEAEGERPRARERKARDRDRERPAATPARAKKETKEKDEAADEDEEPRKRKSVLSGGREGGPLSPAARAVVMRRRLIGGAAALLLLVFLVLVLTGTILGGDDDDGGGGEPRAGGNQPAQAQGQQTQLIGQVELQPTRRAGRDSAGFAAIAQTGDRTQLAIRAKLPPTEEDQAYEVWLFNSREDAVSIGAQRTDAQGNYEGAGEIRRGTDYRKYKYIEVTLEDVDRNAEHSGRTILRGEVANLQAPPPQQQGGAGGQGGTGGQQPAPAPAPAPTP